MSYKICYVNFYFTRGFLIFLLSKLDLSDSSEFFSQNNYNSRNTWNRHTVIQGFSDISLSLHSVANC